MYTVISQGQRTINGDLAGLLGHRHKSELSAAVPSPFIEQISFGGRPIRVAWLRQPGADYSKVNRLLNRCMNVGLSVQLVELIDPADRLDLHLNKLQQSDLVILEVFGRIGRETYEAILDQVRKYSIVPMVILTEDASAERTVGALRAGADSVLLLNMPEEVVLARLHSLLRRWFFPKGLVSHLLD